MNRSTRVENAHVLTATVVALSVLGGGSTAVAQSQNTPPVPAQPAPAQVAPAPVPPATTAPANMQVAAAGTSQNEAAAAPAGQAAAAQSGTAPATPQTPAAQAPAAPTQRTFPDPFQSPPFPFSVFDVNNGDPIGESWDYSYPKPFQDWAFGHSLDASRLNFYGWVDTGFNLSTSKYNNFPVTYDIVPNSVQLDQLVLNLERLPDTVQTDHNEFGFHVSLLYGMDYRFTAGGGWFSDQILAKNQLYGGDPVLMWTEYYMPKLFEGTVFQFGRYISPADIEAQLAPSNYLYTHSLMFSVDPYTYTGLNAQMRFSKMWCLLLGIHAGNDMAPWYHGATPNLEMMMGWNDKDNRNSAWFGLDSIGDGQFRDNHVNEQVAIATFSHKFNDRFHVQSQGYYIWEYNAELGGTQIFGTPYAYAGSVFTGGGTTPVVLPGRSNWTGFVQYYEYQLSSKDYASFRWDFLNDPRGAATGTGDFYIEGTLGISHQATPTLVIRPEIRYDMALTQPGYDINGITGMGGKSNQLTFNMDILQRF